MSWYNDGTIQVAANGTVATGTGTQFIGNVRIGDGITIAGSTALHEVTGVSSNTQLTFQPPYAGAAGSGKAYRIAPVLGYDKDLSDAFNQIRLQWGAQLSSLQPWSTAATAAAARAALGVGTVGDALFVAATQAAARTAMGLGTAAIANTGTSGAAVPLLSGNNTWSSGQTFASGGSSPLILRGNANDTSGTLLLPLQSLDGSIRYGYIGKPVAGSNDIRISSDNGNIGFVTSNVVRWIVSGDSLAPAVNNVQSLGNASLRPTVIYANSGTINTSDAREKTPVRKLTESELEWAIALSYEIGAYQWLASVEEKGSFARDHIGMTVQRAIELGESFGLEPYNYSFICHDQWPARTELIQPAENETVIHPAVVEQQELPDPNDPEKTITVKVVVEAEWSEEVLVSEEQVQHFPAGEKFSFRPDGLHAFIIAGLAEQSRRDRARLDAIEQALNINN